MWPSTILWRSPSWDETYSLNEFFHGLLSSYSETKSTVLHIHIFQWEMCLLSTVRAQNYVHIGNLVLWTLSYTQDIPVHSYNLVPMKRWKWGFCVSSPTQVESHSSLFNVKRDGTERTRGGEREWEINSFLNALCAWPCLLDTTVRLTCMSFQARRRSRGPTGSLPAALHHTAP